MSANVMSFEGERVSRYLDKVFRTYLMDPAHTVYQQGYLQALLDVYREGAGKAIDAEMHAQLAEQVSKQLEPPYTD